ncbi:fimbria/pilus periplasmic chaperone, partial [Escherichia coli]
MQPETTVLIFNEEKNEASISVKNTNSVPSLLQTKIVDIGEAENVLVLSSPSIVKIEPGESQIVRFFLKKNSDFD